MQAQNHVILKLNIFDINFEKGNYKCLTLVFVPKKTFDVQTKSI